jgi:predicted Zn-dependent protease
VDRGDKERARECLHLALNANHNDHFAMFLLARLYLDSGEDPQIAEVLARQCSALAPEKDDYWDLLVRALEVQGKDDEARSAEARKMAG